MRTRRPAQVRRPGCLASWRATRSAVTTLSRPTTRSSSRQSICSRSTRPSGTKAGAVGGRPAELVVEGGEEALPQVAVGGGHRGDAGEAEFVDEAILQGAVDALTAAAGRGRIAEDVLDAEA